VAGKIIMATRLAERPFIEGLIHVNAKATERQHPAYKAISLGQTDDVIAKNGEVA
jgi:hypothetical protein